MQMDCTRIRFASGARKGPKESLACRLPDIRKLLRTDMNLTQIASHCGVDRLTLMRFIKRRQLCDLRARHDFITLQKSTAGEAIE